MIELSFISFNFGFVKDNNTSLFKLFSSVVRINSLFKILYPCSLNSILVVELVNVSIVLYSFLTF